MLSDLLFFIPSYLLHFLYHAVLFFTFGKFDVKCFHMKFELRFFLFL